MNNIDIKHITQMLENLINSDERELVNPKTIESLYNKVK